MFIKFGSKGPALHIVGTTDKEVTETASYFLDLESLPTTDHRELSVGSPFSYFDFTAAPTPCLSRIFEVAPLRCVSLMSLLLSADQSTELATMSEKVQVNIVDCIFQDGGTAFVDALVSRPSSFGSLTFEVQVNMDDDNFNRLLRVDTLEHLGLPFLFTDDQDSILLLSVKVESLRSFVFAPMLSIETKAFGRGFCFLKQFLSRNRTFTVMDHDKRIYKDTWWAIDCMYEFNRFYRGVTGLVTETHSERAVLVPAALTKHARYASL
ncbi:hypothetical protein FisN_26Hu145 [Fistulifera solaris]|uniref:Uncharacterized protein n=1 Tax=Fistulifera solaris TaxID=1519565 RepID=A0A1Z5JXU4_FISSO|nr:hypothetical protein FisN_26Hu145 [Fistulifera solaris]|eukprot:GAX18843.1 hypothetical protein FisN_26Hu145 [Fistulifera solaris]